MLETQDLPNDAGMPMPETHDGWRGPSGAAFGWGVAVVLITGALWGGYYWGHAASTQDTTTTRMDAIEKHTVELSNADRVYFDHELSTLRDTEGRDVIALGGRIDKLEILLTEIQKGINATSITLEGVKSDVKYLVGRKANP
jgi:hypothetical protein